VVLFKTGSDHEYLLAFLVLPCMTGIPMAGFSSPESYKAGVEWWRQASGSAIDVAVRI
jgi:hypothetical protein